MVYFVWQFMFNINVFLSAFALAAGQIVGIGPQNAYVIRQGIARRHIVPIVVICIVCDVLLISLGVLGIGTLLAAIPGFITLVSWLGAGFIAWLGLRALRSSLQPQASSLEGDIVHERRGAIRSVLLLTLLNPYVWLDTVVLIGGLSAAYGEAGRLSFIGGALLASILWFSTVGFLAGRLAPYFAKPTSWRILDGVIALVMFATAISLLLNFGLK